MSHLLHPSRRLVSFAIAPLASASTSAAAAAASTSPRSAYIHLPFCAQRCAYCAFPVLVSGRSALPHDSTAEHPPPSQAHRDYVDLLCREIHAVASRWDASSPSARTRVPLSTLYLGGGTPSLLHPSLLKRVICTVRDTIGICADAEITCEMDPATFTARTAAEYRSLGVNRASVGAQSFDDSLLAACRRVHKSEDTASAMAALRGAGFDNVSIDLISGLPGQTMDTWRRSLDGALQYDPEHVSAYDLTLESGTEFGNKYKSGQGPLPSETLAAGMMKETASVLRYADYEHYEVSNFARRGQREIRKGTQRSSQPRRARACSASPFRSKHNMTYWRNDPFYAFGLGATSLADGFRFARPRRLSDYRAYVENLCAASDHSQESFKSETHERVPTLSRLYPHVAPLSDVELLEDYLINSFRLLVEGVNCEEMEQRFGVLARERLEAAIAKHSFLVEEGSIHVKRRGDVLVSVRLTEDGALVENAVLSTLMHEAVWKYPVDSAQRIAQELPSIPS